MKILKLGFIGYGALGKQTEQLIMESGITVDEVIYFDDIATASSALSSKPFLEYMEDLYEDFSFVISLGYHHLQTKYDILHDLNSKNRNIFTFIHSSSSVSKSACIGAGTIIYPGCNICMNVQIGAGSLIYNGCNIAHDVNIGECCFLGPGVTIAGKVRIAERCFLGSGSTICNSIAIGKDSVIGMATAVTKSVPEGSSVVGNPSRVLNNKLNIR